MKLKTPLIERFTTIIFENCRVEHFDEQNGIIRIRGYESGKPKSLNILIVECYPGSEKSCSIIEAYKKNNFTIDYLELTSLLYNCDRKIYYAKLVRVH